MIKPLSIVVSWVMLLCMFTACRKNNGMADAKGGTIFFEKSGFQHGFVPFSDTPAIYTIVVKSKDIQQPGQQQPAIFEEEPSLLWDYNALHGTNYEILPKGTFLFPTVTYKIQPGKDTVHVPLTVYPDKIDPLKRYVLPLILKAPNTTIDPAKGVMLLRLVHGNEFTGAYIDTISNEFGPGTPSYWNPLWNFRDSVVEKGISAIDDSTVLIDGRLAFISNQRLLLRVEHNYHVRISLLDGMPIEINAFNLRNASMPSYYRPSDGYYHLVYRFDDYTYTTEKLHRK